MKYLLWITWVWLICIREPYSGAVWKKYSKILKLDSCRVFLGMTRVLWRISPAKGRVRRRVHLSLIGVQGYVSLPRMRKQVILASRERLFPCNLEHPFWGVWSLCHIKAIMSTKPPSGWGRSSDNEGKSLEGNGERDKWGRSFFCLMAFIHEFFHWHLTNLLHRQTPITKEDVRSLGIHGRCPLGASGLMRQTDTQGILRISLDFNVIYCFLLSSHNTFIIKNLDTE